MMNGRATSMTYYCKLQTVGMQNAEVKFGPQRAEVTGPRKLHDEGFQKIQAPTQDFLLVRMWG
jgi:hypothetical protein